VKKILVVALVLITALALAGAPGQAQRRNQAVIAIWGLPTRLVGSSEAVAAYVLLQIHEVLGGTDSMGRPVARLAEKWDRSADGRVYTIKLRQAKFHDGTPVTADDVKFSYEFYLHPRYPIGSPSLLEIEGAAEYRQGRAPQVAGITVIDPSTVRFTLKQRYSFFFDQILGRPNYIMPRHAWEGVDVARMLEHRYARSPIGAGPYRLTEWRERESMTFQAFPDYWGGRPKIERVILRLIPEPATVMAEVRAGNIDAGQVLPDEFESFQRNQQLQTLKMPGDVSFWFSFNHQHPFFSDVRVRRAFYHAIDRELMVKTLQKGFGQVVNSPTHPSLWQYNAGLKGYPYDQARARQLLSEAGFTPGAGNILQRDGRPFRARYTFLSEKRYLDQGLMIQQFMRQVGVELTLEPLERGDFFGRFFSPANSANIEVAGIAWFNLLLPVQFEYESNFKSTGAFAHIFQYSNPEIDGLLNQTSTAVDRGAMRALYYRVQELILQDVPRVMTFRPDELWAVQKRVKIPAVKSLAEFFRTVNEWEVR
jgi:peptide/nickel transport system substrate-binding protein